MLSEDGHPIRRKFMEHGNFDAAADPRADWISRLMESRDIAACVVEVTRDRGQLDYHFVAVSPAFESATGLHDAVGRSMRELRPDHEQYWFDLYSRVAVTGEAAEFEHTARALDRRFHGYALRSDGPEGPQVVVIFEDCAQVRRGNLAMIPQEDGEARLERFGATLAHELRSPLAALCNGLHIMRQPASDAKTMNWALSMMERQFARLSGLIDDLLDVGRLGTSDMRVERDHVNLHHVVSESIEACAALVDARQHEVMIDSDGAELLVRGDQRRLTQVFTNLLTNSIKYTEPGGHIRIGLAKVDGVAIIEVADDGIGINADDMPSVFEYFRQGQNQRNRVQGGLGIGLSIVRSIVRLHGGSVSARSDGPGKGSVFTVRLPIIPVSV